MKSIRPPTKTGCLASIPPLQPSREGGTSQSRAHRQYRYYCTDVPLLSHYIHSIYTIDLHSSGSPFNRHIQPCFHPIPGSTSLIPPVVFASHPDSSNDDECLYGNGRYDTASLHPPICFGASGLEDDSGVDAFELYSFYGVPSEDPDFSRPFITRCGAQNSAFSEVALILFTRCWRVASQDGRFA